jgi:Putative beta-barrel porin-2, OmpL-like. bbp2
VVDATWTKGALSGRVALQAGDAGNAYVAAGDQGFRNLQEAWVAWATCADLEVAAGLFLSPIGPEVVATRDDWNWSRSDLFYALPAYHAGVRVKRALGDSGVSLIGMVTNGVNDIVDDNQGKSVIAAAAYAQGNWLGQVLYLGGPERATGAAEGTPWRHLVDAYVQGALGGGLSILVHADAGLEAGDLGTSAWYGAAGYLRYDVTPLIWIAGRGDYVHETRGNRGGQTASAIVLPVASVSSGTATVAYRPADGLDLRVEYRHDHASADAYFGGAVAIDPVTGGATANRSDQDTVTAGAIAWF